MLYKGEFKVVEVRDTQKISDKFSVKEIIVAEKDCSWDSYIPVQFCNEKINDIEESLKPGDEVTIKFSLRGRKNLQTGKCFPSINGYSIKKKEETPKEVYPEPEEYESAPF